MTDPEAALEEIISLHGQHKRNLFEMGRAVSELLKSGDGWAAMVAQELGVSRQSVYNWARGYEMREELSSYFTPPLDIFTPTHFWTLARLREKYGLSLEGCASYLGTVDAYRQQGEPWGSKELEKEIEAAMSKDGITPSFDGHYRSRAIEHVKLMLSLTDLPRKWRKFYMLAPERESIGETPALRLEKKRKDMQHAKR